MSHEIIIRPEAEAELSETFNWYEDAPPGLVQSSCWPQKLKDKNLTPLTLPAFFVPASLKPAKKRVSKRRAKE